MYDIAGMNFYHVVVFIYDVPVSRTLRTYSGGVVVVIDHGSPFVVRYQIAIMTYLALPA